MVLTRKQCLEKYGSHYQIKKTVASGDLFQIERGLYCDQPEASALEILTAKYPKAVITMDTAFYFHNLTDVIPDDYYLATPANAHAIHDGRVRQIFVPAAQFSVGVEEMQRQGIKIRIYNKERMLIELLRNKNKLPYDYYKEIIGNYRKRIYDLDTESIQDYAERFPKKGMIEEALAKEVF